MTKPIDDLRLEKIMELTTPQALIDQYPCNEDIAQIVFNTRTDVHNILRGMDDRLIVVIGPCSIHDPAAAIEYAQKLQILRKNHIKDLVIIMRVYFEKPRTTVGWKGLINDPYLDGSFKINDGLQIARKLLSDINALELPAASEFLDVISPQYIADLIAWGAIGARTTESQVHRELASGLSCPIGFKNGTDGNVKIAIDAIKAANQPHHFLAVTKNGKSAIAATTGNEDCHVILRGGIEPNYDANSVNNVCQQLGKAGVMPKVMIDASHANSQKQHQNQIKVCTDIAEQIANGEDKIIGVMIESHLINGRQDHIQGQNLNDLTYGQSITDACIDWESSVELLQKLACAVNSKRLTKGREC